MLLRVGPDRLEFLFHIRGVGFNDGEEVLFQHRPFEVDGCCEGLRLGCPSLCDFTCLADDIGMAARIASRGKGRFVRRTSLRTSRAARSRSTWA